MRDKKRGEKDLIPFFQLEKKIFCSSKLETEIEPNVSFCSNEMKLLRSCSF